jgi:hypothetical protein
MATGPNTLSIMQAIQYRIFTEVLLNGVSPFTQWTATPNAQNPNNASDLVRFGTNPLASPGSVTTAIYIGMPKAPNTNYPIQCHIIPPPSELVYRKTYGGHVFDEKWVYVRILYDNTNGWYENQQQMMVLRDVMHPIIQRHAEMPGAASVTAAKEVATHAGLPTGFDRVILPGTGHEWDTWGFIWWTREEYVISGGFVS